MSKLTLRVLPAAILAAVAALAAADPAPTAAPAAPTTAPAAPTTAPAAPAPPAAIEAPRFELIDRGDSVEVVAHNIKATRTAILPVRSRLEVAIAPAPAAKRIAPSDHTVKLVELTEESTPVLSVKLAFERAEVKALSRFAQAVQVGDDLHLIIPRKLPEGDVAPRLPEPTLPPALAAKLDARPEAKIDAKSEAKIDAQIGAKIDAKPEATPAARTSAPAAPAVAATAAPIAGPPLPPAPAAPVLGPRLEPNADKTSEPAAAPPTGKPRSAADALAAGGAAPHAASVAAAPTASHALSPSLASDRDDAWSKISLLAALGLAAAGGGVWLMRRRRGRPGAQTSIEVIAQRSLGGKARIVWLSAGQHEMIVSVTAQQVRMLSQWRKTETAAALPPLYDRGDEPRIPTGSFPPPMADKPLSPAVSGLLRLRRTSQMAAVAVDPGDAEADRDVRADDLWAKEILAATTGARR